MKRILIFTFALFISLSLSAQDNTIRLTVSGEGATKEEATANALRSAIEQAFGTFVSANTQIMNDDIVKDEIATISSGNIQEYSELGCITLPNGHKSVSLSATVSIGNLVSYAKSKGSSAEFAGSVWAMNMKMRKLNAENEQKAISHMLEQLDILARHMFEIDINVIGQPIKIDIENDRNYRNLKNKYISPYRINLEFKYKTTSNAKAFYDLFFNTLNSISLSLNQIKEYSASGEKVYGFIHKRHIQSRTIQAIEDRIGIEYFDFPYSLIDSSSGEHSVYFFRTDVAGIILNGLYRCLLNAQLGFWIIDIEGVDKQISFELNDGETLTDGIGHHSIKKLHIDGNTYVNVTLARTIPGISKRDSYKAIGSSHVIFGKFPLVYWEEDYIKPSCVLCMPELNALNSYSTLFATKSLGIIIEENDVMQTTRFAIVPKFSESKSSIDQEIDESSAPSTHNYEVAQKEDETKISTIKTEPVADNTPIPFQLVEEKPSFQGGDINQFLKWVRENQIYPEIAIENGVQGRVTVRATINTDGSLTDIMVVRGVDPSLDKEAIRVVSQSPKWKPGKQGGKAVPVTYNFPVTFQIR